jgi:simple sugar transport system permease protein
MDVAATAVQPKWGLDGVFYNMRGNYKDISTVNCGIIIAAAMAIVMYVVLNKTTFGYELKACGYNRFASRYAGVNEKRSIVLSMVISGALAGLGGGLLYLAGATGRHYQVLDVLLAEGFNGIPVALLGLSNPIGIVFSGIFVSYITLGGNYLQQLRFVPEVIDIIIAIIIYFAAFSRLFRDVTLRLLRGRGSRRLDAALAEGVGLEVPGEPGMPRGEAAPPSGGTADHAPPVGGPPDGGMTGGKEDGQ